jgi:hypothetical protein
VNKLLNFGQNTIYEFVIRSKDGNGMEIAYETLPKNYRRSQVGTGYFFASKQQDHHFVVRGFDRAKYILNHYQHIIRRRKKGGFVFYDGNRAGG